MNAITDTLIVVLVFATLATAWSWLGSYAGVVSLGHAVFFGIGAYAVAASNLRGGSPWYGALGGGLFAVIVAVVGGGLFLRGRGYAFSLVTLAAGAFAEPFAAAHSWLGPSDAFVFPVRVGFLNLQFAQSWPYVLLALVLFATAVVLTVALRATRIGYYLRALRTNPAAAGGTGIAATPPRLLALVASAFVTSVAGSFFAEYRLGVDPHAMFALSLSFDIALIGIIAGPASAWGPPLAALVYVLLGKVAPLHPPGWLGVSVLMVEAVIVVLLANRYPDGVWPAFVRSPRMMPTRRPA